MIEINKKINDLIKLVNKSKQLNAVDKARIAEKIKWIKIEIKFYTK